MDIITLTLALSPVPGLGAAFSLLRFIWSSVQRAEANQQQLIALSQSSAQLLGTLDNEYRTGKLLDQQTAVPLNDLNKLLQEISTFVQVQVNRNFLKTLFTKDQSIARIENYHRRISMVVKSFQISSLVNIGDWQLRNDEARKADQQKLVDRLNDLEANQNRLVEILNAQQNSVMAMLVSLQKRLDDRSDGDRERQFFSHSLNYLSTASGCQVQIEDWMVTWFEVEFSQEIGSGGFGQVFKGTWNRTTVALKVLRNEGGIAPSSSSIRNEVKTWSKIRHPNVLQFLGANVLDEKPFIIMPYLQNGNARDFLQAHPNGPRNRIVHDICLGISHLHSLQIVHGDLKALNVLIDDGYRAVICDFGLSRVKADATSRTAKVDGIKGVMGTRNWMAPERLLGGSLKKPSDIYALGITIYEIFTDEIPLGHIDYADFIELVVKMDVRPERPEESEAPYITDQVWSLAEQCWAKDPATRPSADDACDIAAQFIENDAYFSPTFPSSFSPRTPSLHPQTPQTPSHRSSRLSDRDSQVSCGEPSGPIMSLKPKVSIRGHTDIVSCVTFSIDGRRVISGAYDDTVRVWDVETGNLVLGPLGSHNGIVTCVAVSPDGSMIASGSLDNTLRVWDSTTGKKISGPFVKVGNPFSGYRSYIYSLAFSPDGKYLVSGSDDGSLRVWNSATGKKTLNTNAFQGFSTAVFSVAYCPTGTRVAAGCYDQTIQVYNVTHSKLTPLYLRGHGTPVNFVAFSPDGNKLISGSLDGKFCIWDAVLGTLLAGPTDKHSRNSLCVTFPTSSDRTCVSPDGKWVASGYASGGAELQVWDSESGHSRGRFDRSHSKITSVAFSPEGSCVAVGYQDKVVRICAITT